MKGKNLSSLGLCYKQTVFCCCCCCGGGGGGGGGEEILVSSIVWSVKFEVQRPPSLRYLSCIVEGAVYEEPKN